MGYRNPFNPSSSQFMTGPACARGYEGNNCKVTEEGTKGNTGGGGGGDGGGGDGGDGSGGDGSEDLTPVCLIHTVKSGETLSTIADYYVA